jgi:DNA-binding transcriptional LysR family regulator
MARVDRLPNIEAFVEVATLSSFTRAAKRLSISPSALSRRIQELEASLGVRLLHRSTRTVRLSEEGALFFERARAALAELRAAEEATLELSGKPAGLLRVEAPTIVGRHVVAPLIPKIVAKHPELRVELRLRDRPSDLLTEGIDVALRLGALESSDLVQRRLGTTRMRVAAAPSYLRRRGTPKTVAALERHERLGFGLHGRAGSWRLRDGDTERLIAPSSRILVDDAETLIDLAVQGAGLVWVCDFMITRAQKAGQLVEVLADAACASSPVSAVTLPTRNAAPKVRVFVDAVAAELGRVARDPP